MTATMNKLPRPPNNAGITILKNEIKTNKYNNHNNDCQILIPYFQRNLESPLVTSLEFNCICIMLQIIEMISTDKNHLALVIISNTNNVWRHVPHSNIIR